MQPQRALPLPAPLACTGALLSGLLFWLAFAGMDVWPLAFVAWVPLIVAMHRQGTRQATLLGWLAGAIANAGMGYWLPRMLQTFTGLRGATCIFLALVVCAYQGGRIALLGWFYGRAGARGWPSALAFAGAFAASELLYAPVFLWYYAASVHQTPVLTQLADVGGPILVGVVLVAANLAVAELLLARIEGRMPTTVILATGVASVAFAALYGVLRIRAVDRSAGSAREARVGVVQANMGLMEKPWEVGEGLRRNLVMTGGLTAEQKVDFVVWSESSISRAVNEESYAQDLQDAVARRIGLPAIFGATVVRRVADTRGYSTYNAAISSDAAGTIVGRYDKQHLLLFGEYVPFGDTFPVLYKWLPNAGHDAAGSSLDPLILDVGGEKHAVTALICYEDVLPRFTNAAVRHADPELLVNLTNDAWFADSTEPWEHLALAQLRAIEHRRYLVRGANSGVSAVIDPVGRVIAHTGTFRKETIASTIRWMRGRTVYEVAGDWPWLLVSLGVVVSAFRKRPA